MSPASSESPNGMMDPPRTVTMQHDDDDDGSPPMQLSAGGLVSALSGVQGFNTMWVGWPGGHHTHTHTHRVHTRTCMQSSLPARIAAALAYMHMRCCSQTSACCTALLVSVRKDNRSHLSIAVVPGSCFLLFSSVAA